MYMSSSNDAGRRVSLPIPRELLETKLAAALTELFDGSKEDPLRPLLPEAIQKWFQDTRNDAGILRIVESEFCQTDLFRIDGLFERCPQLVRVFHDWLERHSHEIIEEIATRVLNPYLCPVELPLFDAVLEEAAQRVEINPEFVDTKTAEPTTP
jgi:hypothetical protein